MLDRDFIQLGNGLYLDVCVVVVGQSSWRLRSALVCMGTCSISSGKSKLAGRVCNSHGSPILAFLRIDATIRHQIDGVKQAAYHLDWSAVGDMVYPAQSNSLLQCTP